MSEDYTEIARGIVQSADGPFEIVIGIDRARDRTAVSEFPADPLPRSRPAFKYRSLASWHLERARELSEESGLSLEITSLLLSAEHHLEMYGRPPRLREYGVTNCPCCSLYRETSKELCDGCPIQRFTGEPECKGTPYEKMIIELHAAVPSLNHKTSPAPRRVDEAAAFEYMFLVDLALSLSGLEYPPRWIEFLP